MAIEETFFSGIGCGDRFTLADMFFRVRIENETFSTRGTPISSSFSPDEVNLEFSRSVDLSTGTTVIPIEITQWDKDEGFDDDDQCDISPVGRDLDLLLDIPACLTGLNQSISGDLVGDCARSIRTSSDRALTFRVDVEEQPRAGMLSVRCLHNPIWPQPGETIGITAEALDQNGRLVPTSAVIDDIEIWIDNVDAPFATSATRPGAFGRRIFSVTHRLEPASDQLLYRCRITDAGESVSTGWRAVQIGQPEQGRAVPVLFTGARDSRIDIVFVADVDDYNRADDRLFLIDVASVIRNAYYAGNLSFQAAGKLFLDNQQSTNFWIALDQGNAELDASGRCRLEAPALWNTRYSFTDTGAILHLNDFQDCAHRARHLFSSEPTSIGTVLHETGHSPFGLNDEYCGNTSYFPARTFPNIYRRQSDCLNDPLAAGVSDACLQIASSSCMVPWFRLDPGSTVGDDLMVGSGNRTPQPADARRINWLYDACRMAGCSRGGGS